MRSIRLKLIIIIAVMILAAISIVTFPILKTQIREIKSNISNNAAMQINSAVDCINTFFDEPKRLVKDMALHVTRTTLELERIQKDFESLIKDDPSILCLYYAVLYR